MALVSSWGYTNTTDSTTAITLKQMGEYSNYAKVSDEPTEARYKNRTSPLNQAEVVTYRCQPQKVSTSEPLAFPGPSRDGVFYTIKIEDVLRTTDSADPTYAVDEPISMWLSIKHTSSNNWTNAQVVGVLQRLLGLCYNETSGTWRFEDLMRSALTPTQD